MDFGLEEGMDYLGGSVEWASSDGVLDHSDLQGIKALQDAGVQVTNAATMNLGRSFGNAANLANNAVNTTMALRR